MNLPTPGVFHVPSDSISWSLATLVGPTMGISLYQFHAPLLWILILALSLVSAGLMLVIAKKRSRGNLTEQTPTGFS